MLSAQLHLLPSSKNDPSTNVCQTGNARQGASCDFRWRNQSPAVICVVLMFYSALRVAKTMICCYVSTQSEPPAEQSIGVSVTAVLDPLSTVAWKLAPMLEFLQDALNVGIKARRLLRVQN